MSPDSAPDFETSAHEDHKAELRLWLRMLTCTTLIETEIRSRLRSKFDVTLPRFDLMAQLERSPDGLTMGELSRRMMVSAGNVTGLADRLAKEGLVQRTPHPNDRRTQIVRLTPDGHRSFAVMAEAHEGWVAELLSDLDSDAVSDLMELLARTKGSVRRRLSD